MDYLLYVGSYTTKQSKGIYAYRFEAASGQLHPLGLVAETSNPSFLTFNASRSLVYAVVEVTNYNGKAAGALRSYVADPQTGGLTLLGEVSSVGAGPCYLSLDKTARYALAANFDAGSIASFPVLDDGSLGQAISVVQHHGLGAHPTRQEGPHAHSIGTSPDNRFVLAADLGLDKLFAYRFYPASGSIAGAEPLFAKTEEGSGPRHFVFHPNGNFVYLVGELNSTVMTFAYGVDTGSLRQIQTTALLPEDFSDDTIAAHIQMDASGRFLYVSNRGHDSIVVFAVDPIRGTLEPIERVSSGGKTPRNFVIDPTGKFMLVANQDSDNLVVFHIGPQNGRLTPTGITYKTPTPVFVSFLGK